MMAIRLRGWFAVSAAMVVAAEGSAQGPVRHETRNGVLEIHGLKRWTVQGIEDSLQKYAPGTTLEAPTCAATLTDQLGFAGAYVGRIGTDSVTGQKLTVMMLVEPKDPSKTALRSAYATKRPDDDRFERLNRLFRDHGGQSALQSPRLLYDTIGVPELQSRPTTQAMGSLLRQFASPEFHALARWTLVNDSNSVNRIGAAVALAGSFQNDSSYWALLDAMRDTHGAVSIAASLALYSVSAYEQRPVDWAPARAQLKYAFEGGVTFTQDFLLRSLVNSKIDSTLALDVMRPADAMLLSLLSSQAEKKREWARSFLTQVAGSDLGNDPGVWREWLHTRRYTSTLR